MKEEDIHQTELIRTIKAGDQKAFEYLFKYWYVRLCMYAESIVRDYDVAEDLVQNVFCVLWEKRKEIMIRESLKSYLYRAVSNAALNLVKHEKVKQSFWEFHQKYGKKGENNIERFFDKENTNEILNEINRAIETLPDQCREIFMLSRFAGKKSMEIARELNISVRTVETQLYRAMKHLRKELAHLKNHRILFFFFSLKNCK